jgi:aminoglycoside phosphotransferase (APT) family kinase protein
MEHVPGRILISDADGSSYPEQSRHNASTDLIDALSKIHQIEPDAIGLGQLSRQEDYVKRQLKIWDRQFRASGNRDIPLISEVKARLANQIPVQQYDGLVHGDFRPGNVVLSDEGRVRSVLDWELATLGDTAADLGWLLATWREPGEPQLIESPTAHVGFLLRDDLVEQYRAATGREVVRVDYYVSFSLWRLACISEGIFQRYRSGAMADEDLDVQWQGEQVPILAEAAARALDRDDRQVRGSVGSL